MVDFLLKTRQDMIDTLQISLRAVRQLLGLSAQELGEFIGLTRQTINNLELRKNKMSPTQYVAICAVIDKFISEKPELIKVINSILSINADDQEISNIHNSSFLKKWFSCFSNDDIEINFNIENSEENYMKFLKMIAENYKIFIDDTFLLNEKSIVFFETIANELIDNENMIIVPLRVVEYLQKQILSSNEEEACNSKRVIKLLAKGMENNLVEIRGEKNDSNKYSTFISVFAKHKTKNRLCLLTQNNELANDILSLNEKQEMEGFPIFVGYIDENAKIREYYEKYEITNSVDVKDSELDSSKSTESESESEFEIEEVMKGWDIID